MPASLPDLASCRAVHVDYSHPTMPDGVEHFPNEPLLPIDQYPCKGFPSLYYFPFDPSIHKGVKVFDWPSRLESLYVSVKLNNKLKKNLANKIFGYLARCEGKFCI